MNDLREKINTFMKLPSKEQMSCYPMAYEIISRLTDMVFNRESEDKPQQVVKARSQSEIPPLTLGVKASSSAKVTEFPKTTKS